MKTSKILLTSSLIAAAAMSTVPAWATDYTYSATTVKADSSATETGGTATKKLSAMTADDTVTFSVATSGFFPGWNNSAFAGNIVIAEGGSITISDGSSAGYMTFSGSLSGAGTFSTNNNNNPPKGQDFIFTGDLTSFTGTFTRPNANFNASNTDIYNNKDTGILQFGGTVSNNGIGAGTAYVASATAGDDGIVHNISGTGTITTSSVLRYNYTGSANDGVSSLGIDNSAISARYIDFRGGANYTVSSTVTGNNSTASNNTLKISAGTTTFTGTVSNFGNISVASDATLAVGTSGTLDLSGSKVTLASTIANSGTVTVDSSTVFVLADAMKSDSVYTVISGSGTVSGGSELTYLNFQHADGTTFSGRSTVDVATSGVVKVTEVAANLTWNGGASGTWDVQTSKNWLNGGSADTFHYKDNVTFNTADAKITVDSAGVTAGTMTVSAATTLSGTGTVSVVAANLTTSETLTLDSGVTLDLGSSASAVSKDVSGTGTVKFTSTVGGHGGTLTLGDGFTGTIDYTGKFNTSNGTANSGAKFRLSGGSMWGTNTLSNDIHFLTDYQIGDTGETTITLNGKVTNESGTTLTVGGNNPTVTFGGEMDVSTLKQTSGTLTFSGTGKKTIGTLNATGGTVNFSGTGTVSVSGNVSMRDNATATQSGGTATFSRLLIHTFNTSGSSETYNLNGGVLNITGGTKDGADSLVENSAGIIIGHWGSGTLSTLNVETGAVLNAVDGWTLLSWDTSSAFNINGEANLYGLTFTKCKTQNPTATLTLSNGGRLNLGAGGLANESAKAGATNKVVLNGGTLGALDSWSATVGMSLGGNVTVDTTKMETSSSGKSSATSEGASITLSGVISDVADQTGSLTKSGAGTLTLSGANTYTGGTTVSAGTLIAGSTSALGTGPVSVETNGKLQLGTNAVSIGTLSGAGTIGLATGTTSSTLTVNQSADGTFSGSIGGELVSFVKTGTGALDLSGYVYLYKADFSTSTTSYADVAVNAGTLKISGHAAAGKLSVASGATLGLVGNAASFQSVEISEGAKIVVDMSAFTDKTETFALDILTTSALSYNGVDITNDVSTLLTNGVVSLSGWDKTGWTESLSYASDTNTLKLTMTIPEPSTFGLLAGVGALALVAARRRRRAK